MSRKNTGNLALDAGRGGRRKARRAALDNLFQQARKEVEKAKKRGDPPPDAEQMFDRMYTDSRFRGLMAAVNLQGDQVIGALLRAGAIKKGGKDMAEKEAKVKPRRVWGLFKPVEWRDDYYRLLTRRLITWLGMGLLCLIVVLAALVALGQETMAISAALVSAFLAGFMAGGVGLVLLANKRKGG